jgi:hypothetical protein
MPPWILRFEQSRDASQYSFVPHLVSLALNH